MRGSHTIRALLLAVCVPLVIGAGERADRPGAKADQANHPAPLIREQPGIESAARPPQQVVTGGEIRETRLPLYGMKRFSAHTGGDAEAASTTLRAGVFVGEAVLGRATSSGYRANIGFWLGQPGAAACPVVLTGDVDNSSEIKLSDVIVLVNYVLKAGADPVPCAAAGDVNCDSEVKLSDVIYLVNYVLKAGPPPCDVCSLIPWAWSCP